jgi:3-phenylpropionate/trans-cinnamate dioxygenase subunit beta
MGGSTLDRVNLRREMEDLYYREAWLLDNDKLEEWLTLFTPSIRYWAPVRVTLARGQEDFTQPFLSPHFDDNLAGLQFRVARSRTGSAFAEEYARVRRFITNVLVHEADDRTARISSNFQLFKSRQDEEWFVGTRNDRLVRDADGEWRIEERMIVLDHAVINSITVYI